MVLRKVQLGFELKKNNREHSLNHLLFLDELKLFAKSEEQTDSLVQAFFFTVRKTLVWSSRSLDLLYVPSREENQ